MVKRYIKQEDMAGVSELRQGRRRRRTSGTPAAHMLTLQFPLS
jgi:hypothetical protein